MILCTKGILEISQTFGLITENSEKLHACSEVIFYILKFNTLVYVANALAISCGIQLAYMLVTEGPDEAVEPIMLGVASTVLLILSGGGLDNWTTNRSFAVFILIICIPILYASSWWMKKNVKKHKCKNNNLECNF